MGEILFKPYKRLIGAVILDAVLQAVGRGLEDDPTVETIDDFDEKAIKKIIEAREWLRGETAEMYFDLIDLPRSTVIKFIDNPIRLTIEQIEEIRKYLERN